MEDKNMNMKKKYETPEMRVIKFEVKKDIMAGEENTAQWAEMSTEPLESGVTIPDFEIDPD